MKMHLLTLDFGCVLEEVASLTSRCSFVSFDCEFTGLRSSEIREEWEDTPEERYSKLREVLHVVHIPNLILLQCWAGWWELKFQNR